MNVSLKTLRPYIRKAYMTVRYAAVRRKDGPIAISYNGRKTEFDPHYYRERYSDIGGTGRDPFGHFVVFGAPEGRYPNQAEEIRSLVDTEYYLETYPDVAEGGWDPAEHFLLYGSQESRNPNPYFDTAYYFRTHKSAKDSGLNPLSHYVLWGTTAGLNPSPWFDETYYRTQNADVIQGHPIALWHFMYKGVNENRSPLRQFNSDYYLARYPAVAQSGMGAYEHFLRVGAAIGFNPCPEFDADYYRAHFMDDEARGKEWTPQFHYLKKGLEAGLPMAPPRAVADFMPSGDVFRWQSRPARPPLIVVLADRGPEAVKGCVDAVLKANCSIDADIVVAGDGAGNESVRAMASEGLLAVHDGSGAPARRCVSDILRKHPEQDVVLLDSHCLVGDGWLDRLAAHAYSALDIGSATPFSTRPAARVAGATGSALALPSLSNVAGASAIVRRANGGRATEVPGPGGHCAYLRRDCIERSGALSTEKRDADAETALAEFSARSADDGWRHLLAADVLLDFHPDAPVPAEAAAGCTKPAPKSDPDAVLRMRRFETADPAMPYRFAALAERYRTSGLPVVLIVSHGLGGGTLRHIEELTGYLSGQAHFLILEPLFGRSWKPVANRKVVLRPAAKDESYRLSFDVFDDYDDLLAILRACGTSKVHIHHFIYVPVNLRRLVDDLRLPFDFTVHDYFTICPQVNLTTTQATYCGEPDNAACNRCIAERSGHGARDIYWWRKSFEWLYTDAGNVICPSEDTARRVSGYFDCSNLKVARHAALSPETAIGAEPAPPNLLAGEPIRVAVLGVLAPHKGAYLVIECARAAKRLGHPIEFHVIGESQVPLPVHPETPLFETGPYAEGEAARLLREIAPHVVWFPARWPETYSYTLSEALAAGLPVVVPDLGAFSERLAGRAWTWTVNWNTPAEDVVAFFERIRRENFLPATSPTVIGERIAEQTRFYLDDFLPARGRRFPIDRRDPDKLSIVAVLQENRNRYPGAIDWAPDACGYIRGLLPLSDLADSEAFEITIVSADRVTDYVADIFFTQRNAISDGDLAETIIAHCRAAGTKIVYDIDDDLFGLASDHSEFTTYRETLAGAFRFITQADLVFASTERLKSQLSFWNTNIEVVPNALADSVWDLSGGVPNIVRDSRSESVRIVYMGTMTHGADFAIVEAPLRRLCEEFGARVSFEIVGVALPDDLPDWCRTIDLPPEITESYPAFVNWLQSANHWHIGLAPLVDTNFNRAKSGIKYLDYAALGLAVAASDIEGYRGIISDGTDGVLVRNAEKAWYEALRRLVMDHEYRQRLQENAMAKLASKHRLSGLLQKRMSAFKALLREPGGNGLRRTWLLEDTPSEGQDRESIAARFLKGKGLEVGALHNPLAVPEGVSVSYVDRLPKETLYAHYPELREYELVDIDIIDNGETLSTIPENSQDFVIANHFLEHCEDPLGTLSNLVRVLNREGVLYAAVPDRRFTFDRNRKTTSLDHLIADHEKGPSISRSEHFVEWARLVEPEFGQRYETEDAVQARARELDAMDYSIHFHVWEPRDVWEMLRYSIDQLALPVTIEHFTELPEEILFILRRI